MNTQIQLTYADFDDQYLLDSFPDDCECPICTMVKLELLECPKCYQQSCRDCNISYSSKNSKANTGLGKFECTTCHEVNVFNPQNLILKEIMHSLLFKCDGACLQVFPLKELYEHKGSGLCYRGYVRPAIQAQGFGINQS